MVNASFVFGMDGDDATVFDRTVEWAIEQGIETATFHIMTFYRWNPIRRGAMVHDRGRDRLRHIAYAGGWKKLEPAWDVVVRSR